MVRVPTGQMGNSLSSAFDQVSFVIMPYFWQGSPLDAAQRLRYCVKNGFDNSADGSFPEPLLSDHEIKQLLSSSGEQGAQAHLRDGGPHDKHKMLYH